MKKSYLICITAILIALSITLYYVKVQPEFRSSESVLTEAFKRSGAKIVNAEMYFWGEIDNQEYKSIDDLKGFAVEFSRHFGIAENNKIFTEEASSDSMKEVKIKGNIDENRIVGISVLVNTADGKEAEGHISVTVMENSPGFDLEKTSREVISVFEKFGIRAEVNSCLTGSFNGRLGKQQLNGICREVFKETDAKRIEGLSEANLISVSAYSPFIENYVEVMKGRVNLNIALRYNSYEDKTYIWLATPVITIEY